MDRVSNELPGKLDKEQLDSLKLETSALSPREHKLFLNFISECNTGLTRLYRKFIDKKKYTPEDIEQKFLLTDEKTYGEFFDHWFTPQIAQIYLKEGNKGGARTYLNEQGDFVIFPVPDYWSTLSEDDKQSFITQFGGKEEAQNIVRVIATGNLATHEIAHLYESPLLPLLFAESGAYYYANDTALFKGWYRSTTNNSKRAAEFYATLIDKYGDDVHRVFFGQKMDAEIATKILNECTKEAQNRVFPNLHLESS